ncbi:MAG: UbiA family prenyltransferase [Candidatus Thorarchaeota archaeon]
MFRRILLFRNLVDNIPKNIGLYAIGIMLLLIFDITIDPLHILLGLIAFLTSYSSIYILNDLYDVEEDKTDERKTPRKPIALEIVSKKEALAIAASFIALGLLLSIILSLLFFYVIISLVFINLIYSVPSAYIRHWSQEENLQAKSLKQTILGIPLILLMQSLKILLPWTLSNQVIQFPILFAIGFSFLYIVIFKGYKEYLTIGQSVVRAPFFFGFAVAFFIASMSLYPAPLIQASIVTYLLVGIVVFRNSHITDRRVLLLSPVYILLGIIILIFVITTILPN